MTADSDDELPDELKTEEIKREGGLERYWLFDNGESAETIWGSPPS
jgi:hypothetical protein